MLHGHTSGYYRSDTQTPETIQCLCLAKFSSTLIKREQNVLLVQVGSNMTGTDLCVNKPHCAAAVRP